jgi:hypothetical protein
MAAPADSRVGWEANIRTLYTSKKFNARVADEFLGWCATVGGPMSRVTAVVEEATGCLREKQLKTPRCVPWQSRLL